MTDVLFVAAGGGGDAIAAAILAAEDEPELAAVATLSWDRLVVDPLPGPRSAAEFTGLAVHASGSLEATARTALVAPAGSLLPRLAVELEPRMFLLDPSQGVHRFGRCWSGIRRKRRACSSPRRVARAGLWRSASRGAASR